MKAIVERLFPFRADERQPVLFAVAYAFGSAAAYVIGRSVADSLFLSRIGPQRLPVIMAVSAITVALASLIYSRFAARYRLEQVIGISLALLALMTLALRAIISTERAETFVVAALYVLVELRGGLGTIQFSSLTNEVFASSDPKRIFGFISVGATLAGILFGVVESFEVYALGTANLLYLVAGLEVVTIIPVVLLARAAPGRRRPVRRPGQKPRRRRLRAESPTGLRSLIRYPYIRSIAAMVCVSVMVGVIVQYQWKAAAAHRYADSEDSLTRYFAIFYACMFLATGLLQLFGSGWFLRHFGILVSLALFPASLLLVSVSILATATNHMMLWTTTAAKGCDVFKRTIHDPALKILYWPMTPSIQRQVIAMVGGLVKPAAEALAAVLLLYLITMVPDDRKLAYFAIVLTIGWITLAARCRRQYIQFLGESVRRGRLELTNTPGRIEPAAVPQLLEALESDREPVVIGVLELLRSVPSRKWEPQVVGLLGRESAELRRRAVELLAETGNVRIAQEIQVLLRDADPSVRASAITGLCRLLGRESITLVDPLLDDPQLQVRAAGMIGLVRWAGVDAARLEESRLRRMLDDGNPEARITGVHVLASIRDDRFLDRLRQLIGDKDANVSNSAIRSAGQWGHPDLTSVLIERLANPMAAATARAALIHCGPSVLAALAEVLADPTQHLSVRREIPRVLERIPTKESLHIALAQLQDTDPDVRGASASAIHRLCEGERFVLSEIERDRVRDCYRSKVEEYYERMTELADILQSTGPSPLTDAIGHEASKTASQILRLLATLHPNQDIETVIDSRRSPLERVRVLGTELLNNILDDDLKPVVLVMAGQHSLDGQLRIGIHYFPLQRQTLPDRLRALTKSPFTWVRATVVHQIGEMQIVDLAADIESLLGDPEPVVAEIAHLTLERLRLGDDDEHRKR